MKLILVLLLMCFVAVNILVAPCLAGIDPETAVGIYLFEEGKGNEVIDGSGKGHDGITVGGNGKREDGKFGSAMNIAEGGWVRIETTDALHPVDAWTIVAWFNIENIADHHTIVTKWDEYLLRVDTPGEGSRLSAFVKPGGNWEPRASATVPKTETWIHAALVWDNEENGASKIYMDGAQAGQSFRQGKIAANANPLCIGSQTGGWLFPGLIDDVGIFNVPLEEDDIKFIMENGLEKTLGGGISVEPQVGLATTWGELKIR